MAVVRASDKNMGKYADQEDKKPSPPSIIRAIRKISVGLYPNYKPNDNDGNNNNNNKSHDNQGYLSSPSDTIEKIKKGEGEGDGEGIESETGESKDSSANSKKHKKSGSTSHDKDKIPLGRKLALAIGAAPLSMPIVSATVFITLFLLDVVLLKPKYSSLVLLLGRSFDAISDPLVGFLVNKTQRRGNTLKYWMGFAIPFLLAAYFLLWVVPMENGENQMGFLCYYLGVYILLQIAFTIYSVPYASLIMYQTNDQRERDIATAFRMTAEIVFAIVSIAVMGGIVGGDLDCDEDTGEVDSKWLKTAENKYMIAAGTICALIVASGVVTFLGTNERSDITIVPSKISTWTATKRVMKHKPYLWLTACYFCMYLSVSIIQGNLQLYFKYHLDRVEHFAYVMVTLMVCVGVGIPVWQVVISKVGKKNCAYIGVLILIPCYGIIGFVPSDVPIWCVYLLCGTAGFAIGSAYFIPWSMLPDVIDNYTVENGERNESIFFGFFVFFNKFAAGAGIGISLGILEIAGYSNEECHQPEAVQRSLRILCSPGPGLLVALYAFFVFLYPITEKKCKENKAILDERLRKEKHSRDFYKYVNRTFEFDNEAIEKL